MELYERQVAGEINIYEKTNAEYQDMKKRHLQKVRPTHDENAFLKHRKEVERQVDEGFKCELVTEDNLLKLKKAKHAVSELEDKLFDSMIKNGEQFEDPRIATPEDKTHKKKYPHLSDEVDKLLTEHVPEKKQKFTPLDYSKFKFAKQNKKVNKYRISNFDLPKT